ncbi:hypothetical protein Ahy_A05g025112 [Arachis hypogaea]|uniref:Uncharacterized protein n=1 Tax=Arachis hypogaea TaxID=3818 RepID=A0A445D7K9_ARAHY|nr:hypothetical protein Ahy_A05g025112 [Arachis hypogaea]
MKGVRYWHPIWVGDDERQIFEVQQKSTMVFVNLLKRQLTDLPYVYALAVIARRGDRPEIYVHPLLKIGTALATYQHNIQPVNSEKY